MDEAMLRDVQVKDRVRKAAEFLDPSQCFPTFKGRQINTMQVINDSEGAMPRLCP